MARGIQKLLDKKATLFIEHKQKISEIRQQVMKFDFNQLFAVPGKFDSPDEKNSAVQAVLESVTTKLPRVYEMFPHLWDQHQGYSDANRKIGGRKTSGIVPGAWNEIVNDYGVINNEKGCIELLRKVEEYNSTWQNEFELRDIQEESKSGFIELSQAIEAAIGAIDSSMSYETLADAVAKIIKDSYGEHLYEPFSRRLMNNLYGE